MHEIIKIWIAAWCGAAIALACAFVFTGNAPIKDMLGYYIFMAVFGFLAGGYFAADDKKEG